MKCEDNPARNLPKNRNQADSGNSRPPGKHIGILAGKLTIPDDFDAPLPAELLEDFAGDSQLAVYSELVQTI